MTPEAAAAIRGLTEELAVLNAELANQSRLSKRRLVGGAIAAFVAGVFVVAVGAVMVLNIGVVQNNQEEIKLLGELQLTESLRRERDVLDHRIKQEDCVVRPLNETIQKRINAQTNEPIDLCNPEPAITQLEKERANLDRVISEREAIYAPLGGTP